MSDNKKIVDLAIIKYKTEHGKLPSVADLETLTELPASHIMKWLSKDYPSNLRISAIEQSILTAYLGNQSIKGTSDLLGVSYVSVNNALQRLITKGFETGRKVKPKKPETDEKPVYIKVTKNVLVRKGKGEKVNLKGGMGYTKDGGTFIYVNCVSYKTTLNLNQYEIIGG